eukprot:GILJ01003792.1.p1 GENE.GILJ01003792.1~~GILJ01003792.1.p1  ORF type:complete len:166 (-),score=27.85 GILJ01003792.1:201-698(-)
MASRSEQEDKSAKAKEWRREMQEKLKQYSKAPQLAELQIKLLDQMVHKLKQDRHDVGVQITEDQEELQWVEKEVNEIKSKYDPLVRRMTERKQQRDELVQQLQQFEQSFQGVIESVRDRIKVTNKYDSTFQRKAASESLTQSRGFSTEKGTTASHRVASKNKTLS